MTPEQIAWRKQWVVSLQFLTSLKDNDNLTFNGQPKSATIILQFINQYYGELKSHLHQPGVVAKSEFEAIESFHEDLAKLIQSYIGVDIGRLTKSELISNHIWSRLCETGEATWEAFTDANNQCKSKRMDWLYKLHEFTHGEVQKGLWFKADYSDSNKFMENIRIHSIQFKEMYEEGIIHPVEFDIVKETHENLNRFYVKLLQINPKDLNEEVVLSDPDWVDLCTKGKEQWDFLSQYLSDPMERLTVNSMN